MTIQNNHILTGELLFADVKKHMAWLADIAAIIAFQKGETLPSPPNNIFQDLAANQSYADFEKEVKSLQTYHQSLKAHLDTMNTADSFTQTHFDILKRLLDTYVAQLKRIERLNAAQAQAVYSTDMSMKTDILLHQDILSELNRVDRRNAPFCVASISLDEGFDLKDVQHVASLLVSVLRSFDDAYYMGEGKFTLSLKDIDILDATRVMERFRKMTEKLKPAKPITISCGLVEPVPGDSPETVLAAADAARRKAEEAGGNMIEEYSEKSALAKLAQGPISDV